MRKEEIAIELYNSAKENGFLDTIYEVIGQKVRVSVAFTKKACDTNIDDIEFSVRATNALKRAGYFTIGDVVEALSNETLIHIRNLGKKTFNEIQTKILVFGYERLTEKEKQRFFVDLVERNCE
jgi:DNA-directed RNA polymerase alpha subunit